MYIPRLERALGFPIVEADFQDPAISERSVTQYGQFLRIDFRTHPGSLFLVRDPQHVDDIWDIVASTLPWVQGLKAVFLHPGDSLFGAVQVDADLILRRAAEIMSDLNHDINLFTPDLGSGFCLELKAWGQFVPTLLGQGLLSPP